MHNWKELLRQNVLPLLLVLGVVTFLIYKQLTPEVQPQASAPLVSTTKPTPSSSASAQVGTESGKITVDVKGAVHDFGGS